MLKYLIRQNLIGISLLGTIGYADFGEVEPDWRNEYEGKKMKSHNQALLRNLLAGARKFSQDAALSF